MDMGTSLLRLAPSGCKNLLNTKYLHRAHILRLSCALNPAPYIEGTATAAPLPDFCQRSSLRQSDRVAGSKFSDCCEALRMAGPDPSPCCIASTTKHLQKESWHITVGGNAACSDMACTSMYGARISEARQMFEGTLTTLLNPKRVISKCTITRRA
ncbi:hypothetical protein BDP67DRAFT_568573 [Colletotrichum lupini]|nr:hypothetical protein BDP67DRAFT_568573 [Colletotrichum lupini]